MPVDHERHNRTFWDADADDYQALHGPALSAKPKAWGVWRLGDDELGVLGDLTGLDVLEYGCGGAQWSIALVGDGARAVGLDQSRSQLHHARRLVRAAGDAVPLVCASGEQTPFANASFDVVFCDHGVMSFCDPEATVPEVTRVLRPGARFVFCHTTPWRYLTWDDHRERESRRLHHRYFGIRRFDAEEGTADFQLTYGDWIRLFRRHGLVVDDLLELQAPKRATTTYDFDQRWSRRWPAEQIWVLHKS